MPIPACGSRAGPQVFAHRHLPITGDHGVAAYPFTTAPAHNASAFYTARQGDRPASGVLRGQHPRYYAPVVRTGVFSTRETDSLPTRDHRAFIWPNQPPPLLRTGPSFGPGLHLATAGINLLGSDGPAVPGHAPTGCAPTPCFPVGQAKSSHPRHRGDCSVAGLRLTVVTTGRLCGTPAPPAWCASLARGCTPLCLAVVVNKGFLSGDHILEVLPSEFTKGSK